MGIFAIFYRTSGEYYEKIIYFEDNDKLLEFMKEKWHRWVIVFEDMKLWKPVLEAKGYKVTENDIVIELELYDDWRE